MTNEELKVLIDKATPGPWSPVSTGSIDGPDGWIGLMGSASDAAFVAAAREALPRLLEYVRYAEIYKDRSHSTIAAQEKKISELVQKVAELQIVGKQLRSEKDFADAALWKRNADAASLCESLRASNQTIAELRSRLREVSAKIEAPVEGESLPVDFGRATWEYAQGARRSPYQDNWDWFSGDSRRIWGEVATRVVEHYLAHGGGLAAKVRELEAKIASDAEDAVWWMNRALDAEGALAMKRGALALCRMNLAKAEKELGEARSAFDASVQRGEEAETRIESANAELTRVRASLSQLVAIAMQAQACMFGPSDGYEAKKKELRELFESLTAPRSAQSISACVLCGNHIHAGAPCIACR